MKKSVLLKLVLSLFIVFSIFSVTSCSTEKTYTVTWKNHDGTVLETDSEVVHGSTPTYDGTTPEKAYDDQYAYIFNGWSPTISSVTADIVYTAQFTSSTTGTISFDSRGGNSINAQDINIGDKAIAPENPTKEGYTFDGWYLNGEAWSFTTKVTESVTLIAKWKVNSYHLSLDCDETQGSVAGSGDYNYGNIATITATPTVGFIFDGWYQGTEKISSNEETKISIDSSNKSLKAKFIMGNAYFEQNFNYTQDENGITITGVKDKEINNLFVPEEFDGKPIFHIQQGAFKDCTNLTSITLPFIGDGTGSKTNFGYIFGASSYFSNSNYVPSSLERVIITQANDIDDNAFYFCMNLTSITIPEGVKSIGDSSFSNCKSLTSFKIPSTTEIIGEDAFWNCHKLTSITIPEGVTNIGEYAFSYCINLKEVTIPESAKIIGHYAFNNCRSLTSITIPKGVKTLESFVFKECIALKEIVISDSVTSIEKGIFSKCYSLESIIVDSNNPNFDSRNNCNAIIETATNTLIGRCKKSIIPDSVEKIGEYAFSYTFELAEFVIPDNITTIEENAFIGCDFLTSITIPYSIESIASSAFAKCISLESIIVDSNNPKFDSRNNCNAIIETDTNTLIIGCGATIIPNGVKRIGDYAFSDCQNLTSITLSESIENIGKYAFYYCINLTSITLSNSLEKIGSNAFNGCKSLIEIVVPNGVESIEEKTFYLCENLTEITIQNGVKSIDYDAFYGCYALSSITIPESIESIASLSIYAYESLVSIIVDPNNDVYDSRNNCNAIIETATNTLIVGCINTIIPDDIEVIGNDAFYFCESLTTIIIPSSVKEIGGHAFYGCHALSSITIPDSIELINSLAFWDCRNLSEVIFENQNGWYYSNSSVFESGTAITGLDNKETAAENLSSNLTHWYWHHIES